jgi:hypothetical protein
MHAVTNYVCFVAVSLGDTLFYGCHWSDVLLVPYGILGSIVVLWQKVVPAEVLTYSVQIFPW